MLKGCRYREIVRATDHGGGLESIDGVRVHEEDSRECGLRDRELNR